MFFGLFFFRMSGKVLMMVLAHQEVPGQAPGQALALVHPVALLLAPLLAPLLALIRPANVQMTDQDQMKNLLQREGE